MASQGEHSMQGQQEGWKGIHLSWGWGVGHALELKWQRERREIEDMGL
jgi:hypothetical protein